MTTNLWVSYIRIIIKRWWILVGLIIVTLGTMLVLFSSAEPKYHASVRFWVTTPPAGDVALYDEFRSGSAREETAWARANFLEVLNGGTVAWMTVDQVGTDISGGELLRNLEVRETDGSEFITLVVGAHDPQLAAVLANTLVEMAIQYYGELRAQPAVTALEFVSSQIEQNEATLADSERDLIAFQTEHDVIDLDSELSMMQGLIGSLQQLRDQSKANGDVFSSRRYDEIILERKARLHQIAQLRAEYAKLRAPVTRYQALLNLLLEKQIEAQLKVNEARNAAFIQVIESARVPNKPSPAADLKILLAGLVGAVILGVFLTFFIEAFDERTSVS